MTYLPAEFDDTVPGDTLEFVTHFGGSPDAEKGRVLKKTNGLIHVLVTEGSPQRKIPTAYLSRALWDTRRVLRLVPTAPTS